MAGFSLINLGAKAIPALQDALTSTNELIRRGAATALQGIPTEFNPTSAIRFEIHEFPGSLKM
jgi:HEAT repeat protein